MMNEKLYVMAKFVAKSEHIAEMKTVLEALASQTQTEPGCLDYGYYQASDDPTVFTSFEAWADSESEATHWGTQHVKDALARMPELTDGAPAVTKYVKVA
jgi:quinol monooxygenase YgiN